MHFPLSWLLVVVSVVSTLEEGVSAFPTEKDVHPALAHLSKRELQARDRALSMLPDVVRRDLEAMDPREYELPFEHLLEENIARRGLPSGPGITTCANNVGLAMTYDDGLFVNHQTIAQEYANAGQKVTFFVNVNNWDCSYNYPYPEWLQQSLLMGHEVGSHTGTHPDLTTLSHEQIDEQIQLVETFLWDTTGRVPSQLRPPYGSMNDDVLQHLHDRWGLTVVQWSRDSGDSVGADGEQALQNITASDGNDIILNHETNNASATVTAQGAIQNFAQRQITLKTVSECVQTQGGPYKVVRKTMPTRDNSWSCSARNVPAPGQS